MQADREAAGGRAACPVMVRLRVRLRGDVSTHTYLDTNHIKSGGLTRVRRAPNICRAGGVETSPESTKDMPNVTACQWIPLTHQEIELNRIRAILLDTFFASGAP